MNTKTKLLYKTKLVLNSGLVVEVVIWTVIKNKHCTDGMKYRLLLADPLCLKVLVLLDNHAQKGHHRHDSNGAEYFYDFVSVETLVKDFVKLISIKEELYENNEN